MNRLVREENRYHDVHHHIVPTVLNVNQLQLITVIALNVFNYFKMVWPSANPFGTKNTTSHFSTLWRKIDKNGKDQSYFICWREL